jgi:FkbH-like protein
MDSNHSGSAAVNGLKTLLLNRDEKFWPALVKQSTAATTFSQFAALSSIRKKAKKLGLNGFSGENTNAVRIGLIGGSTLFPLSDLIEHLMTVFIGDVQTFTGDYNNYRSEILEDSSALYEFEPDFVIVLPDEQSCKHPGMLNDSKERVEAEIHRVSSELLHLCSVIRERADAEILLCNFILPSANDLGPIQAKSLASEWNFKKAVNLELGTKAPNYVHICNLEFLAYRLGGLIAKDDRSWFESKQLCSPSLQVDLAREITHIVKALRTTPKKVLVLDLDNTLWGGVIGDDGIEGIEIGDTSPRGEAFKAFQSYILSLTQRGLLLAVCSKNDFDNANQPFREHPEMVLREEHFVSFKANWEPKGQNLIVIANELNLGLDSFIFVDDNPAEVENVRQFAPEVTCITLDPDPSAYVRQLQESRLFERTMITGEDVRRTEQYREEATRRSLLNTSVDMDSYLRSLDMVGTFREFNPIDLPRIAQLINKSNQFNLTTRRRLESDLAALVSDPNYTGFSMRLADRFGDHGLISVVICKSNSDGCFEIDTWLMSCRVLKRQVEEQVLNEIVRLATDKGCVSVKGTYIPTAKNAMVSDLYSKLGFSVIDGCQDCCEFELAVKDFTPKPTFISVNERSI